jgi:hypothetical protein
MTIPDKEKSIGFEGDNLIEVRQFKVSETALFDFEFKLDLKNREYTDIIDLVKTVEADKIILTWTITRENVVNSGRLNAQLRAFSGDDEVWHSNIDYFTVSESINAEDYYPEILPSEFTQMESRVTAMQTDVTEKAAEVEADRAEVASNTTTVNTKAGEALQSAANAYASEVSARESAEAAHDSEVEATRQAGIALNNILNGVSTHNSDIASHPSILSDIGRIEAIARGKATAKVFDTIADMDAWLAVPGNVETLNVGDNLYIVDVNVPDYWWDGTEAQELEAEAVNLADYYTKTEVDNRLPIAIEQTDYDALVAAGTVIAGRIYYVVPDGELT